MSFQENFVRVEGGGSKYYTEYTTTNLYVLKSFGGNLNTITVSNDSTTDTIQISWNGSTLDGDLKPGETMSFNVPTKTGVYIKGSAGGGNVRIWGW